jgi:drug/metabolite transporter (DMT)-like permease
LSGPGSGRWLFVLVLMTLGVGWGSTQALGKMATATGHQPFGLIVWQSLIAVLVLSVFCLVRRKPLVVNRRTVPFYLIVALIGTSPSILRCVNCRQGSCRS